MSAVDMEEKVCLYEDFFRDPRVGEGILQPGHSGIACKNIRDALSRLGYSLESGNQFDGALKEAVLKFQTDRKHEHPDGFVGPNTRRLLTRALIDAKEEWFFKRGRVSPEYAIFLSYSRDDELAVQSVIHPIQSKGIPVFVDKQAIPGGAVWPDVLYRSIRKCQVFLCMLSPHSAASTNVLIELALARHADRPILPVLLQAAELPSAMQALLDGIQYIDLSGRANSEEAEGKLLDALEHKGLTPAANH